MFSFFSMQKLKKGFFAAFVFVLLTGFLIGCDSNQGTAAGENMLPNGLLGRWVDPAFGDGYELTRSSGTERLVEFFPDFGEPGDVNFVPGSINEGIIRHVIVLTNTAGIIITEHTGNNIPNPSLPFGAVSYRNLTAASVEMATAWELSAVPMVRALAANLDEAKEKFTADTILNYIGFWGGPYVREN